MCECSFQFRLWSINFDTLSFNFVICHPFSSIAIQIRRSQWLSTRQQNQFRLSAFIFVKVSIKFVSQVYRPNNTWRIWMTEYWICVKEWRIWSYIPYSPSDTDEFQWQLTNLNAEFLKLFDKRRMWMIIWRNWTLDLNAVKSFSGRNLIENWWIECWGNETGRENLYYNLCINIQNDCYQASSPKRPLGSPHEKLDASRQPARRSHNTYKEAHPRYARYTIKLRS